MWQGANRRAREAKEAKEAKEVKEVKEAKETKELRKPKKPRKIKEARELLGAPGSPWEPSLTCTPNLRYRKQQKSLPSPEINSMFAKTGFEIEPIIDTHGSC